MTTNEDELTVEMTSDGWSIHGPCDCECYDGCMEGGHTADQTCHDLSRHLISGGPHADPDHPGPTDADWALVRASLGGDA